ncbi:MAG TPA: hypothetical protein VKT32_03340 [Chthonomonadaceae bacterium]|nr:hypothetical protein [Chthonomonadaceae bacterium]
MRRQGEENAGLSPENAAILKAWLQSREAPGPAALPAPDTTQMVHYLSGALSSAEARAVERGLVSHPLARRKLRQVRTALLRLQEQPWSQVLEQARQAGLEGEVAKEWAELVSRQAAAMPQARARWLSQGWSAVRRQAAEGMAEALAAWTAFCGFAGQWQAALRAPRMALARGGEAYAPAVAGDLPAGFQAEILYAEITNAGTLQVSAQFRDAAGRSGLALEGRKAHLALRVAGESWPVASGAVTGGQTEWSVPDLGPLLDLPAGQLPPSYLEIVLGEWVSLPGEQRQILLAEALDAQEQPIAAPPAPIGIVNTPRWEAGQLHIVIAISEWTRAAYPAYRLRLEYLVSPQSRQRLGEWPVADWDSGPRALAIPCPGSVEGPIPTAALRALLQAPAG